MILVYLFLTCLVIFELFQARRAFKLKEVTYHVREHPFAPLTEMSLKGDITIWEVWRRIVASIAYTITIILFFTNKVDNAFGALFITFLVIAIIHSLMGEIIRRKYISTTPR